MEALPRTIEIYQNEQGGKPYREWLDQQPKEVQAIVDIRLKRVEKGLLGDHHAEGSGVWALIFDDGPGTRVYYGLTDSQKIVLLLVGGNKKRQNKDIQQAIAYWEDFKKSEKPKEKEVILRGAKMGSRSVSYHEDLIERLKDPENRVAYVNAALKDGDPSILLAVLEDCAEAMGGVPKLAKAIHVSPQAIYKMFSGKGNPRWENLNKILETLGFRINVSIAKKKVLARA